MPLPVPCRVAGRGTTELQNVFCRTANRYRYIFMTMLKKHRPRPVMIVVILDLACMNIIIFLTIILYIQYSKLGSGII